MCADKPQERFALFSRFTRASPARIVVFAAVLLAASWISIRIAQHMGGMATLWLTNGFILAALFRTPTRQWIALAFVAFSACVLADVLTGHDFAAGCIFSIVDLIEVFVIAVPMRRFGFDKDIRDLRSLVVFLALAFGLAIPASAILTAAYLEMAHGASFMGSAAGWYMADGLGLIQVAPAAMLVKRTDIAGLFKSDQFLPALASMGVLAIVYLTMARWPMVPLGFLLFPCILVFAFQQSYAGVAFGLMLITAFIISNLLQGHGYLASAPISLREKIFFLQFFFIVLTGTMLVVTSILFEKKKAEQRLREATQSAIEARNEANLARLEADRANLTKSQFLANMSHELRTPLNAILGFSEIIRDGGVAAKGTGKIPEYAEHIHSAGSHLLDLVNDILDTSKIEAGKYELDLERLDLLGAVREAMALVEPRASERGVALSIEEPNSAILVLADRRAVKQISLNLISNAVKFTPSGGSVAVAVREVENGVVIVVKDTGIGIPASELPRLGRPFERVRNQAVHAQPGTGLGLALVRALATLHGGTLKIESVESQGTTVSVCFPGSAKSLAA